MTTEEAITWAGSKAELARRLDLQRSTINGWGDYPPPLHQFAIERQSGGSLRAEAELDSYRVN